MELYEECTKGLLIHVKAERFDFISITKKSGQYKLETIRAASKAMIEYIRSKD